MLSLISVLFKCLIFLGLAGDQPNLTLGSQIALNLPKLMEGCEREFPLRIINDFDKDVQDLASTHSCACIHLDLPATTVKAKSYIDATLQIKPGGEKVYQVARLSGTIDGKSFPATSLTVDGIVLSALRPSNSTFSVGENEFGVHLMELEPAEGVNLQNVQFVSDSGSIIAKWRKPSTVIFELADSKSKYTPDSIFPNDYDRSRLLVKYLHQEVQGSKSIEIVFYKPRKMRVFPSTAEAREREGKLEFSFLLASFTGATDSLSVLLEEEGKTAIANIKVTPLGGSKFHCVVSVAPDAIKDINGVNCLLIETKSSVVIGQVRVFSKK